MDIDCLLYLEQRLSDLEKRLLYHEEKEYYKYLVAGQSKKALEMIIFVEHEPKKETIPKRLWMSYHK
jgi:hypothetical protein